MFKIVTDNNSQTFFLVYFSEIRSIQGVIYMTLLFPMCMTLHLSTLNFIFHFSVQVTKRLRFSCNSRLSVDEVTLLAIFVSSANFDIFTRDAVINIINIH